MANGNFTDAYEKFEARLKRMNALHTMMESCEKFVVSEFEEQSQALKTNPYFPAIKRSMLLLRLTPYETRSDILQLRYRDASLLEKARQCDPHVASEVLMLQNLEAQASASAMRMLSTMSDEIPWCVEEIRAAMSRARSFFNPVRGAIAAAIDRTTTTLVR